MHDTHIPRFHKLNLAWAISITIGISALMVGISVAVFFRSGAYDTVKQIRAASTVLQTSLEGIDTSSPIQATDLEEYSTTLPQRVRAFNDTDDFSEISL